MAIVVLLRDFAPKPIGREKPVKPAEIIVLPVVRIERPGRPKRKRKQEA